MSAAHPLPPPTEEQLRLAYRQLARPHTWPPFEAACRHRVFGTALRALARMMGRAPLANTAPAHRLPIGPVVPPDPPFPSRRLRASDEGVNLWTRRRGIDWKRAAANDLED